MWTKIPILPYFRLVGPYLKQHKRDLVLLVLLLILGIGVQIAIPWLLKTYFDSPSDASLRSLLLLIGMMMGLGTVYQLLVLMSDYIGEHVGWSAANRLRSRLMRHCLSQDISFFHRYNPGELLDRVDGAVNGLAEFFYKFVVRFTNNVVLLLVTLGLLYTIHWSIGAVMTAFIVLAALVYYRLRDYALPYWVRVGEMSSAFFGFIGEQLTNTEDTRSSGASGYVMGRFKTLMRNWFPLHMEAGYAFSVMWMQSMMLLGLSTILTFAVSAWLWHTGTVSAGTIYMLMLYAVMLVGPIDTIRIELGALQRASANIERIRQLFDIRPAIEEEAGKEVLKEGPLSAEFREVTFGYSPHEPVLHGIRLRLEAGQSLGIVGRTGSGKSSIARLLLRLYDPQQGSVLLEETDIRRVKLTQLRQRVGIVTQDVQIFKGSVRDNLTFFNPAVPDDKIEAVLEDLGLASWYAELPEKLDTQLEAGGGGLSAGEAQLLAFARVFLKEPGLVILDEASSRLDPVTEEKLEQAVRKLLSGRTAIVIAHRLQTLRHVDRILVVEDGRIIEHDSQAALLENPDSRYSQLLRQSFRNSSR
ncbi:ABC transporter ATP-binding protein [Paenibacillus sp. FJAT-26967]|uniref:ABC transporter ATP-binding protein n=1 Tax=Paenibacillus sp. FJAT-26967 TaxID=1729690 RepID=UPI0008388AF5|nr:ABC transporter ATP-binding protein [Paenibacillus sp. FJAT-26967]